MSHNVQTTPNPMIIYIAHPISGNIPENIAKVESIMKGILTTMPEVTPIAPYLNYLRCLDDNVPAQRERGMKANMEVLESGLVEELWLYGDKISQGMWDEIVIALVELIEVVPMSEGTKLKYK